MSNQITGVGTSATPAVCPIGGIPYVVFKGESGGDTSAIWWLKASAQKRKNA